MPRILVGAAIAAWLSAYAVTPIAAEAAATGRAVEIVVLYRSDCAPCRHELNVLPRIAAHYPDLTVTLLVLRDDGLLETYGDALHLSNLRIRDAAGTDMETMARYGDDRRGLPFSAALDAAGRVCARRYGLLGLDIVGAWRDAC